MVIPGALSALMALTECFTFASAHAASVMRASHWKDPEAYEAGPPTLRQRYLGALFRNNFRNPLGVTCIGATFCLPVWLYTRAFLPERLVWLLSLGHPAAPGASYFVWGLGWWLTVGRVLAMVAEYIIVADYAGTLLQHDVDAAGAAARSTGSSSSIPK